MPGANGKAAHGASLDQKLVCYGISDVCNAIRGERSMNGFCKCALYLQSNFSGSNTERMREKNNRRARVEW